MELDFFSVIVKAAFAFAATNIDDIFLLTLWFLQADRSSARVSIIAGQYLGFAGLVSISLFGLLGRLVIPQIWMGLLGLFPIVVGGQKLLSELQARQFAGSGEIETVYSKPKQKDNFHSAVWQMAAVTFGNGGDNIGIYIPLSASSGFPQVLIILILFFVLVAVWCGLGYWFTQQHAVEGVLSRYGHKMVPFVLIGLGVFILMESETYRLFIGR